MIMDKQMAQDIRAVASMSEHHGSYRYLVADCDDKPALAHFPGTQVLFEFSLPE